jgi:hypothetical protein
MKNEPRKHKLTKQEQDELGLRSRQLVLLLIQAECGLTYQDGRKYILVPSIYDDLTSGMVNMIDVTDEIKNFVWTGVPSAREIVSMAIQKSKEEDERL